MQPEPDREGLYFFEWAEPLGLSVWSGGAGWWNWERPFVRWAEANGYRRRRRDHDGPRRHARVLDGMRLFVSRGPRRVLVVGHARRRSTRTPPPAATPRSSAGTRAAGRYGSRTIDRTMTWYKYRAEEDPVVGTAEERFLTRGLVGSSDRTARDLDDRPHVLAGAGTRATVSACPRASGAYTVRRPEHWLFDGHRSAYGDALGLADTIVAYEVDGCELTIGAGRPARAHPCRRRAGRRSRSRRARRPTSGAGRAADRGTRTSRANSRTCGDGRLRRGLARARGRVPPPTTRVLGVFTTPGGGTVVNAGVTDWACGLRASPILEQVTRNVLRRLSV